MCFVLFIALGCNPSDIVKFFKLHQAFCYKNMRQTFCNKIIPTKNQASASSQKLIFVVHPPWAWFSWKWFKIELYTIKKLLKGNEGSQLFWKFLKLNQQRKTINNNHLKPLESLILRKFVVGSSIELLALEVQSNSRFSSCWFLLLMLLLNQKHFKNNKLHSKRRAYYGS